MALPTFRLPPSPVLRPTLARWLAARGLKEKERYNWKIIGIPDAEALVEPLIADSAKLQNAFARLIEKPEGKLTYAPESDKRSAVEVNNAVEVVNAFDLEIDDI